MYCILKTAIEALPAFHKAADIPVKGHAGPVPNAGPATVRHDKEEVIVCLTDSQKLCPGSDAFEFRWTSLAA